jgi:hypothetical protein
VFVLRPVVCVAVRREAMSDAMSDTEGLTIEGKECLHRKGETDPANKDIPCLKHAAWWSCYYPWL